MSRRCASSSVPRASRADRDNSAQFLIVPVEPRAILVRRVAQRVDVRASGIKRGCQESLGYPDCEFDILDTGTT